MMQWRLSEFAKRDVALASNDAEPVDTVEAFPNAFSAVALRLFTIQMPLG
jgi:hypothetical protein